MIDPGIARIHRPKQTEAVWPLPQIETVAPTIVGAAASRTTVDVGYVHQCALPRVVPALAVNDGIIAYAGKQHHGHAVLVDHENGWATYYANLEHVFTQPTSQRRGRAERVKTGDVLGYVGAPAPGKPRCLWFELWRLGDDRHYTQVDPSEHMKSWLVLPWTDDTFTPSARRAA